MNKSENPIVIIDDDAITRQAIRKTLTAQGYDIVEANSVGQALSGLTFNPSLAIMGYKLSQSDVINWVTRLRERGNNMPVIFIASSWCDQKTFSFLRNVLHIALILQKPIVPELFLDQVESLLPRKHLSYSPQLDDTLFAELPTSQSSSFEDVELPTSQSFSFEDALPLSQSPSDEAAGTGIQETSAPVLDDDDEMARMLAEARQEYEQDLPGFWEELRSALNAARQDGNQALVAVAALTAHRLRGNAGSYGYALIGELAGRIEQALYDLAPLDEQKQQQSWMQVMTAMAEGGRFIEGLSVKPPQAKSVPQPRLHKVLAIGAEKRLSLLTDQDIADVVIIAECDLALAKAQATTFDAVILDAGQLDRSAVMEACKELRSLPGYECVPLGMVSQTDQAFSQVDQAFVGASVSRSDNAGNVQEMLETLLSLRRKDQGKVLVIDDDPALTRLIDTLLANEGFIVHSVNEPINALGMLEEFKPDLVLLDVMMPGLSGYDICRMIRSMPQWRELPILFLTAKNTPEGRSRAFQAGGSDFLSKPVVAEELLARVNCYLLAGAMLSGDHARQDALTRMPMLSAAMDEMRSWLTSCQNNSVPLSLSLIRVDHFEERMLMDGPSAADEMVTSLGKLIQCRFKAEDIRARWGGAGFSIAFPGENKRITAQAVALLQDEFNRLDFVGYGKTGFTCTFSSGESDSFADGATIEQLISTSYRRLTRAKRAKEKVLVSSVIGMPPGPAHTEKESP